MADDATKKVEPKVELKDPNSAPVLPLRDIVVFPHMIVPLFVGREKSVRALEEVMNDEKQILLLTQKNAAEDDPTADEQNRERVTDSPDTTDHRCLFNRATTRDDG